MKDTEGRNIENESFAGYTRVKTGTRKVPQKDRVGIRIVKDRRKGLLGWLPFPDRIRYHYVAIYEFRSEKEEDVYETLAVYRVQGGIEESHD